MRTAEFDTVVSAHQPTVLKTACRLLGHGEDAKDAAQEVFLRLLRNHSEVRGDLGGWLYRVTVNVVLSIISKEKYYKNAEPFETVDEMHAGEAPDAAETVEASDRFKQIMNSIEKLPAEYQEILSLFYFGELSIDEIARSKVKSSGSIKAVLWKGRRAIVHQLKKQGVYELL